jgi:hypothetical protein
VTKINIFFAGNEDGFVVVKNFVLSYYLCFPGVKHMVLAAEKFLLYTRAFYIIINKCLFRSILDVL